MFGTGHAHSGLPHYDWGGLHYARTSRCLGIPGGTTIDKVQLTCLLEEHKDQVERANQAQELMHTLKQMIIKAVPERNLAILHNPFTGAYEAQSARQILTHLKRTVATLTDDELQEKYDRIAATTFDPHGMEVTEVMADIRFLGRLATAINNPYSDAQLMRLALKIFTNCGYFSQGIRAWKARPVAEHSLDNIHQHSVWEHATLHELNQSIGAMAGHQVNM